MSLCHEHFPSFSHIPSGYFIPSIHFLSIPTSPYIPPPKKMWIHRVPPNLLRLDVNDFSLPSVEVWEDQVQTLLGSECDDNETLQPAPWASKIGMPLGPGLVKGNQRGNRIGWGREGWLVELGGSPKAWETAWVLVTKIGKKNTWVFPKIGFLTPQIIPFNRVFHHKPSILRVLPLFLETST